MATLRMLVLTDSSDNSNLKHIAVRDDLPLNSAETQKKIKAAFGQVTDIARIQTLYAHPRPPVELDMDFRPCDAYLNGALNDGCSVRHMMFPYTRGTGQAGQAGQAGLQVVFSGSGHAAARAEPDRVEVLSSSAEDSDDVLPARKRRRRVRRVQASVSEESEENEERDESAEEEEEPPLPLKRGGRWLYEVDEITKERCVGGVAQVKVKWAGYELQTWEPKSAMTRRVLRLWREKQRE